MTRAEMEPIHVPAAMDVRARLVVLPHAGGAAAWYRCLREAAEEHSVEVHAVRYPGHTGLLSQPPATDIATLARLSLTAGVQRFPHGWRDTQLFGHSMGALVTVHLAMLLSQRGTPPRAVHVSSSRPPSVAPVRRRAHLPDEGVVRELGNLDPNGQNALEDPDLAALFLPVVRADLLAAESYRKDPVALDVPVSLHVGDADPETPEAVLAGWSAWSTGEIDRRVYPGGHFWLRESPHALLKNIIETDRKVSA